MRCYCFGNFYLSSIQQGIQAFHVGAELFVKYVEYEPVPGLRHVWKGHRDMLFDWATNHKTLILLNGGDADALLDIKGFLNSPGNSYPHAFFEESVGALNHCLTSVGIVIPERMYDKPSDAIGREVNKAGSVSVFLESLNKGLIPVALASIEATYHAQKYTPWELEFLSRRVRCDLAK